MNKTIIINIGGTIFHIEEDAYDYLKNYMSEVKRSLHNNPDSFEIVTDIENRFAELFNHILEEQNKQVVVAEDVKSVMAQMGNPAEFNNSEEKESEAKASGNENFPGQNSGEKRRLFRDSDDRVIGGVCAGLAHYFDVDPIWVRLGFALILLFGGFSLIPYIILWIAVPVAKTRADKISMKGGVVNLDTIRQSVEQDLKDLTNKAQNWKKENINADTSNRVRNFFGEIFEALGKLIVAIFHAARGFLGLLMVSIGGCLLISLFVTLIAFFSTSQSNYILEGFFSILPREDFWGIGIVSFLLVVIPLIFIIIIGLRILFKKIQLTLPVVQTLLVIWFISLGLGTYYGVKIANQYRHRNFISQEIPLKSNSKQVYRLKLDENLIPENPEAAGYDKSEILSLNQNHHRFHFSFGGDWDNQGPHNIDFRIERSDSNKIYLQEKFTANGPTRNEALRFASQITVPFQQRDSVFHILNRMNFPDKDGFRAQSANLILFLPIGTSIWIDHDTRDIVSDLYPWDTEYEFHGKSEDIFIMTSTGLKPKFGTIKPKRKENLQSSEDTDEPEKPAKPEKLQKKEIDTAARIIQKHPPKYSYSILIHPDHSGPLMD